MVGAVAAGRKFGLFGRGSRRDDKAYDERASRKPRESRK